MRNVFDQYQQPENRLTHALVSALVNDRKLVRPFLRWLGVGDVPQLKDIRIGQQQIPGDAREAEREDEEGLPDACFYTDEDWAVLIESKVQAGPSITQLRRHEKTARRQGFADVQVILIAVDPAPARLPKAVIHREWKGVYAWFGRRRHKSEWAARFTEYMEVLEAKLLANEYNIRGTLTMFDGFHFSDDHPYTYMEGKRLLRLVRAELQKRKTAMRKLGLSITAPGRGRITSGNDGRVWDLIPLKNARGSSFTSSAHLTIGLGPTHAQICVIIPNNIEGGVRARVAGRGKEALTHVLLDVEKRCRRITKRVPGAQPFFRVLQRHWKSRSSNAIDDVVLDMDLRVLVQGQKAGPKYQPGWMDGIYEVLSRKRSNIEVCLIVRLPYAAAAMQTAKAIDTMTDAALVMKPFLEFVMRK